jgi:CMD domain protein
MSASEPDVIDLLAGVARGPRRVPTRARRPEARAKAQKSYLALFAPKFPGAVSAQERFALAAFVAGLHGDAKVLAFYREGLTQQDGGPELSAAVDDEIARGAAKGPYGRYPAGPLSAEDKPGPIHHIAEANRARLGARLSAAFEHAHLLVFRPRDASPAALQALLDAGWSTTDIVTLSQLVAFLSFQIRVVVGLRALAAAGAAAIVNS